MQQTFNYEKMRYFIGGFTWGGESQFERFVREGIWENGYGEDRYKEIFSEVSIGDMFALKSSFASKEGVSYLRIKQIGIINSIKSDSILGVTWIDNNEIDIPHLGGYRQTLQEVTRQEDIAKIFNNSNEQINMKNYIELLENNKNLIFTGAPGTGKTYLAKQIAKEMIGLKDGEELEDNEQYEFVQFHPSYDYTDFVEGLRPVKNEGQKEIGFELKDGIFKDFCKKALIKTEVNLTKDIKEEYLSFILNEENEDVYNSYIDSFCIDLESKKEKIFIEKERQEYINFPFYISDEEIFYVSKNDDNALVFTSSSEFKNTYNRFPKKISTRAFKSIVYGYSTATTEGRSDPNYYKKWHIILEYCIKNYNTNTFAEWLLENDYIVEDYIKITFSECPTNNKKYVFIIDEINRAEISKVFGELFFSIDPEYRGKKGKVKTQYSNLQEDTNIFKDGFFIPKNVYIIGTMNDIDRSVESMDFAMRRRFAWQEITAEDSFVILDQIEDKEIRVKAKNRLTNLNDAIDLIDGLNSAYHIGASYFLKLKNYNNDFYKLWNNHLKGLLFEYLRSLPDVDTKLDELENAYNNEEIINFQNNG